MKKINECKHAMNSETWIDKLKSLRFVLVKPQTRYELIVKDKIDLRSKEKTLSKINTVKRHKHENTSDSAAMYASTIETEPVLRLEQFKCFSDQVAMRVC